VSERPGEPGNLLDQAAAYALGVLPAEEARSFERELAQSDELQRAVAEYREICALLATARGVAPPAELKARLLDRVRREQRDR
jgi:anti-sigma-K factor RskA